MSERRPEEQRKTTRVDVRTMIDTHGAKYYEYALKDVLTDLDQAEMDLNAAEAENARLQRVFDGLQLSVTQEECERLYAEADPEQLSELELDRIASRAAMDKDARIAELEIDCIVMRTAMDKDVRMSDLGLENSDLIDRLSRRQYRLEPWSDEVKAALNELEKKYDVEVCNIMWAESHATCVAANKVATARSEHDKRVANIEAACHEYRRAWAETRKELKAELNGTYTEMKCNSCRFKSDLLPIRDDLVVKMQGGRTVDVQEGLYCPGCLRVYQMHWPLMRGLFVSGDLWRA